MPIYEFYCGNCNTIIEEILPVGSKKKIKCKECGKFRKIIMSSFLGIIKGSENRSLDCTVGESSEIRWKQIHKRKEIRDKVRKTIKEKKDAG